MIVNPPSLTVPSNIFYKHMKPWFCLKAISTARSMSPPHLRSIQVRHQHDSSTPAALRYGTRVGEGRPHVHNTCAITPQRTSDMPPLPAPEDTGQGGGTGPLGGTQSRGSTGTPTVGVPHIMGIQSLWKRQEARCWTNPGAMRKIIPHSNNDTRPTTWPTPLGAETPSVVRWKRRRDSEGGEERNRQVSTTVSRVPNQYPTQWEWDILNKYAHHMFTFK